MEMDFAIEQPVFSLSFVATNRPSAGTDIGDCWVLVSFTVCFLSIHQSSFTEIEEVKYDVQQKQLLNKLSHPVLLVSLTITLQVLVTSQ
jgi:uncharacterized membrane protein